MIDLISKHSRLVDLKYDFTILIPSWNNLEYLQSCIASLRKNSGLKNQIIVIVNEGKDGTKEWVDSQTDLDFVYAKSNIGICYGLNSARSLVKSEYIVYVNDDMYMLPDWDKELFSEISKIGSKSFMLSSTMIEPLDTGNPCVIVRDYGTDLKTFNEDLLLKEFHNLKFVDWNGSMWPPNVIHVDVWDLVGGLSIEFSPGLYSDPDLAIKLYELGIRIFKGKGTSLVYHFGSKSTNRLKKSRGQKLFLLKWGVSASIFKTYILKLGTTFSSDNQVGRIPRKKLFLNKIKRVFNSW
ncbi:MAG: glycosyltransferase family 2 protein [Bacteroidota bacterium]|jgi:glycosyltransferase involved in cell wall biosynthesis